MFNFLTQQIGNKSAGKLFNFLRFSAELEAKTKLLQDSINV